MFLAALTGWLLFRSLLVTSIERLKIEAAVRDVAKRVTPTPTTSETKNRISSSSKGRRRANCESSSRPSRQL